MHVPYVTYESAAFQASPGNEKKREGEGKVCQGSYLKNLSRTSSCSSLDSGFFMAPRTAS